MSTVPPAAYGGPAPDVPDANSGPISPRSGFRRYAFLTVGVVVIIVVMVVLAYTLTGGFQHHNTNQSTPEVLVPQGSVYSLPAAQFAGITVILNSTALLQGLFLNSFGITLYTMPISQYHTLVKWDNVTNITDYQWTSGRIANGAYYTLDVSLPVGTWVFAFVNPSPSSPTGIAFYSNVTLSSA